MEREGAGEELRLFARENCRSRGWRPAKGGGQGNNSHTLPETRLSRTGFYTASDFSSLVDVDDGKCEEKED